MFEITGLIFIHVFLLILGTIAGAASLISAAVLTRKVRPSLRKRLTLLAVFVFPIASIFYLEAGLVLPDILRSISSNGLFHYPLANGYELVFYDELAFDEASLEDGYLSLPRGNTLALGRIHGVQVAGDYLYVHAELSESPGDFGRETTVTVTHGLPEPLPPKKRDRYIEIDTRTDDILDNATLQDLQLAAARRGQSLQLKSSSDAYKEVTSAAGPGWMFNVVFLAPLLVAGVWLFRKLLELRRSECMAPPARVSASKSSQP